MTLRTHASLFAAALVLTLPLAAQDSTIALIGTTKVAINLGTARTVVVYPLATIPVIRDLHQEVVAPLLAATSAFRAPIYVQTVTVGAEVPGGFRLSTPFAIADGIESDQRFELEHLRVSVLGPAEGCETRTLHFRIVMPTTGWRLELTRVERSHEAVRSYLLLSREPGLGMPALQELQLKLPIGNDDLLYAATYLARVEQDADKPVFELVDLTRLMK